MCVCVCVCVCEFRSCAVRKTCAWNSIKTQKNAQYMYYEMGKLEVGTLRRGEHDTPIPNVWLSLMTMLAISTVNIPWYTD